MDTKTAVPIEGIKGYMNEGSSMVNFEKGVQGQDFASGVFSAQNKVGEYMCYINIDKAAQSVFTEQNIAQSIINSQEQKKHEKYMLIMWSVDGVQPQYLDESLGPVDYLRWVQVQSMKNWAESEIYRLQIASNYAMILVKERSISSHMYLELEIEKNDLIEGNILSKNKIQLSRYQDEDPYFNSFYFCILRNANNYKLNKKSSYIKDPFNQGPAGEISSEPKLRFLTQ